MKFIERVEKLQKENEGTIILVKNDIFFVGIGKDAVILENLLRLKVTCMKPGICKVGFPIKNVEKYIQLLTEIENDIILRMGDSITCPPWRKCSNNTYSSRATGVRGITNLPSKQPRGAIINRLYSNALANNIVTCLKCPTYDDNHSYGHLASHAIYQKIKNTKTY